MRVLLDECLPARLKAELPGYEVRTVPEMGWAGKKNGELLHLAEAQFGVFITMDQNLLYQQNLRNNPVAILTLVAKSNAFEALRPLVPRIEETLRMIQPGQMVRIE
jgi:predicted nuclease of predicted toxin-antitoxin system